MHNYHYMFRAKLVLVTQWYTKKWIRSKDREGKWDTIRSIEFVHENLHHPSSICLILSLKNVTNLFSFFFKWQLERTTKFKRVHEIIIFQLVIEKNINRVLVLNKRTSSLIYILTNSKMSKQTRNPQNWSAKSRKICFNSTLSDFLLSCKFSSKVNCWANYVRIYNKMKVGTKKEISWIKYELSCLPNLESSGSSRSMSWSGFTSFWFSKELQNAKKKQENYHQSC